MTESPNRLTNSLINRLLNTLNTCFYACEYVNKYINSVFTDVWNLNIRLPTINKQPRVKYKLCEMHDYPGLLFTRMACDNKPSVRCVCVCDSVMISVPPQAWEMSFLTVPDMPVSSALTVCLKRRRVWKSCQSQSCLISDGPKPQTAVCSWGNWKMLVFSWTFIGNCNPNLKLFWNTHTSWRLNTGCDYTVTPLKDWCIL